MMRNASWVLALLAAALHVAHAPAQQAVPALHYYLFSTDGRVYRAYDDLPVPGGDASRFDFDAAQRADPGNSGRYTVKGNQLIIQIGGQPPETITTAAPQGNRATIHTVLYVRQ